MAILDRLYADASVYLDRKYELYRFWVAVHNGNIVDYQRGKSVEPKVHAL